MLFIIVHHFEHLTKEEQKGADDANSN